MRLFKKMSSQTDKRHRILLAAARLFAEKGFERTSVRDICQEAAANVAAVNYYFQSKENLYQEVFRYLFEELGRPFLELARRPVYTSDQWRRVIREWILTSLDTLTHPDPPRSWAARLFGRERASPSRACPILYEKFFEPIRSSLHHLIWIALAPTGRSEEKVNKWTILIGGACMVFAHKDPPWDRLLLPPGVEREKWLRKLADHYVRAISRCLPEPGSQVLPKSKGG